MTRCHRRATLIVAAFLTLTFRPPYDAIAASEGHPLTTNELIVLCATRELKRRPDLIIKNFVRKLGIGFLPTQQKMKCLKDAGVHADILKELRVPETYTRNLMVRICEYQTQATLAETAARFAQEMRLSLSDAKLESRVEQLWPLLRGIPFDAGVGPVECYNDNYPRRPGKSYVMISGSLHKEETSDAILSDTVFTYYPLDDDAWPLRESWTNLPVSRDSAEGIVRAAMKALEDKLR
jgi:hypothetical protein